ITVFTSFVSFRLIPYHNIPIAVLEHLFMAELLTRRHGNFLYISKQSVFAVLYRLYNHC
ncbi:MAG: hypothetical protein HW390_2372, partial [Candidatus Brocadiaceae bacterium]|nr:hypothetical protein [Candidatus Brocadiaceae bacterium]